MKHISCMLILVFLTGFYSSTAQKTVDGLKFSACLNKKELPAKFYKRKFLVLDFWATWCGPCIESFPRVSALQKKYKSNPQVIFAALTPEPLSKVDTFFHRKKDMMPGVLHLVDDSGATWSYFDVNEIPNLLVFSPSGKIVFSGRAEELSGCMDKLLKGQNLYKQPEPQKPAPDKWKQYKETASFIAVTAPADTSDNGDWNVNYYNNYSSIRYSLIKVSLLDILGEMGVLSPIAFKYNDSTKANQLIALYYKQVKNDFPEFDKGIFKYQYQNHILDLLEKIYSFHCEWMTEKVAAYKIIVKDKQLLASAATLSTKGSASSTIDAKKKRKSFTNRTLSSLASTFEDYLKLPAFADTSTQGYDVELEFSSVPVFEKSLSNYGLALEKIDGYEMKKLKLTFY